MRRALLSLRLLPLPLLLATPAWGAGDLLVAPTRIVLDGARGTEVILSNKGTETATYRVSLELRRMDANGRLVEVVPEQATAHERAALEMISYAPRRVTLAPEQPQAIRIGLRPPVDLPDGEYRAHLLFRAIPDALPAIAAPAKGVAIALTPIYGVTIPVIVRRGSLSAQAALANPRRCTQHADGSTAPAGASGAPALCFDLSRTGTRSTYGRVVVTTPGQSAPVVDARGIAVYAEAAQRTVVLPLQPAQIAALKGTVRIEYREESDSGGTLLAALDGRID